MKYNKEFVIEFAEYHYGNTATAEQDFDKFLEKHSRQPQEGIYLEVLTAAAEMCNISMGELSNGRKYGDIPTTKQLASKILHELGFKEKDISKNLPMLGLRITVHKQITKAGEYEESDKNFRKVLIQLRSKFNVKESGNN